MFQTADDAEKYKTRQSLRYKKQRRTSLWNDGFVERFNHLFDTALADALQIINILEYACTCTCTCACKWCNVLPTSYILIPRDLF